MLKSPSTQSNLVTTEHNIHLHSCPTWPNLSNSARPLLSSSVKGAACANVNKSRARTSSNQSSATVDSEAEQLIAEYSRPSEASSKSLGETLASLLDAQINVSTSNTSVSMKSKQTGQKKGKKSRKSKSIVLFST